MSKVVLILQQVLVNYFYKVNAALFTFCFFVLFGLPSSPLAFHLSLITGILKGYVFLGWVLVTWLLYNLKCINYIVKQLHNPRQAFLSCLNNLPLFKFYLYMLYVHLFVYLPVLLYAAIIFYIGYIRHQYYQVAIIAIFNLLVIVVTPFTYMLALQPNAMLFRSGFFPRLHLPVKKYFFLLPLYFVLSSRKQMLFVTKIFTIFLLFLFFKLYQPEGHDIRPLQLCLLLVAASHSTLIFEIRSFEEEQLWFSRNLPISLFSRFFKIVAMYGLLLLPEFIFLLKGAGIQFLLADYPQLLLMAIALMCMFHIVLLLDNINTEQFIKVVFGIMAGCFFIILYSPGIFLAIAIFLLAFSLYYSYYYTYENRIT